MDIYKRSSEEFRLPPLPEWDKTAYPYAVIIHQYVTTGETFFGPLDRACVYGLVVSPVPFTYCLRHQLCYTSDTYFVDVQTPGTAVKVAWYCYDYPQEAWSPFMDLPSTTNTWKGDTETFTCLCDANAVPDPYPEIVWTSHDIMDTDNNTVYLKNTQPTKDLESLEYLVQGYITGLCEGRTDYRDSKWPIRFETDILRKNTVTTYKDNKKFGAYKVSDIVISPEQMENLEVWWTTPGKPANKLWMPDSFSVRQYEIGCMGYFIGNGTMEIYSFGSAGEDTILGHTIPEPGTYILVYTGYEGFCSIYPPDKEPIAYLYNGVRLPKLPEWDRGVYPFATIVEWNTNNESERYFRLTLTKGMTSMKSSYSAIAVSDTYLISMMYTNKGETEWNEVKNLEGPTVFVKNDTNDDIIWANHDILNTDGSVYLQSSEPVAVYE